MCSPVKFFAMLGPSGRARRPALRLIAGLEQPTAGAISIFGDALRAFADRRYVDTCSRTTHSSRIRMLDNAADGPEGEGCLQDRVDTDCGGRAGACPPAGGRHAQAGQLSVGNASVLRSRVRRDRPRSCCWKRATWHARPEAAREHAGESSRRCRNRSAITSSL